MASEFMALGGTVYHLIKDEDVNYIRTVCGRSLGKPASRVRMPIADRIKCKQAGKLCYNCCK